MIFLSQQIMENYWTNNNAILRWRDASSSYIYCSDNGADISSTKYYCVCTFLEHQC